MQQQFAAGTKLTTPFGTTYTVTDPNQFFATGPGGYNPITAAAAQPTSQPALASPSVPTNTNLSTAPLAPAASATPTAPALPVSKPVDPITTFVQSSQFTSAPAGTIVRNAQTGQQYYKTSGGGLVTIKDVAQLQQLAQQGLVRPGSDIYYNQPSANITPTPPASSTTPPPGATLITGPSGLQGLTESQIWRQPGTNNIYRLAPGTSASPAAPPGAPNVPTQPVDVKLGDYIPSDIFTGAFTMPKSTYDIGAVIASQQKMQQAYLDSLQPSAQEQDLNSQLQKILDQASGTQINLQAGLNKIEDQPIPMPFITGQQASIQRQANTQLQSLALQQQSLAQRLGLVQQSRLAQSEGLKTAVGFGTQNIQLAFQMQQAIDAQQQAVLERAAQLQSSSREVLATILDKFQGLDFSTLDPASQQQLLQVAAQAGIPADVLVKGMETVKNQAMLDQAVQMQKLAGTAAATVPGGVIDNWAKSILDGSAQLSNVPEDQRTLVNEAMRQLQAGGYKSTSPILTPAQQEAVKTLSSELAGRKEYKDMTDILGGFQAVKIGSSLGNGAGDLMMINGLQKMVDPGSIVRESEFKTVEEAQGFLQKMLNLPGKIIEGTRLTDEARKKFLEGADKLYAEKAQSYDMMTGSLFKRRAEAANVPYNLIGTDFPLSPSQAPLTQLSIPPATEKNWDAILNESMPVYGPPNPATGKIEGMAGRPISVAIPVTARLAYVNNNPGNLRFAGQPGAVQGEGGFAKFSTPTAGVNALIRQIKLDASRGLSLAGFVNKYAPPSENDTQTYLDQIVKWTGARPTTALSSIDYFELAKAIARKESSTIITPA